LGELVDRDQEHLRLLQLAYYILAGITAFFSLFSLLSIVMGGIVAFAEFPKQPGAAEAPRCTRPDLRRHRFFFLYGEWQ